MEILILFLLGLKNIRLNFLVARNMARLKVVCFVAVPFGGLPRGVAICFRYCK